MKDFRGIPVSTDDPTALALYEQAITHFQSYAGDPIATMDRALAERPDFIAGHALRAAALIGGAERRFFALAADNVKAAEALLPRANERERLLVRALRLLVDGDWYAASAAFDRVLVDYPRDIVALQTGHIFDFARGDAKNLRDRISRVLPSWSASVPGYSFVLGLHAFGLEECNEYDRALATAEAALAIERKDPWAVHAAVHVREMRGEISEGIHFLESRRGDWAADNTFAFHNWWHLGLFHLDRGDTARVLEIYDQCVYPADTDFALILVDATAMLWRLQLLGVDVGDRFERIANAWAAKLDGEQGFYAFNDVHAILAFAGTQRQDAMARVLGALETPIAGTNGMMVRDVGLPLARAIVAFASGRYSAAADQLAGVRDIANRFGGSHAQRDLITLTIIESALRSGQKSMARHYLNERAVHRPGSALGWRLQARLA